MQENKDHQIPSAMATRAQLIHLSTIVHLICVNKATKTHCVTCVAIIIESPVTVKCNCLFKYTINRMNALHVIYFSTKVFACMKTLYGSHAQIGWPVLKFTFDCVSCHNTASLKHLSEPFFFLVP